MLPIWIINLTEDEADKKLLAEFVASVKGQQHPFWYYSEISSSTVIDGFGACKLVLNELVKKGRDCYTYFQKRGYTIFDIQICIIGNAAEEKTRTGFQVIPLLLRRFMPNILGQYLQRDVEITGILFTSHAIDRWVADDRKKCAWFFEEMNTLMNDLGKKFYNRVVLYQEIQRSDMQFYPELDKTQVQEFLFEILIHLFYIGKNQRKIFDQLSANAYYSLGAASIYYDSDDHKSGDLHRLFESLIKELKNPDNVSATEVDEMIADKFPTGEIAAENILSSLCEDCKGLDAELSDIETGPVHHPLSDFSKTKVYLSYYLDYLKFIPARAAEFSKIYSKLLFGKITSQIRKNKEQLIEKYTERLRRYDHIFQQKDYHYPTLPQLRATVAALKEKLTGEKVKIEGNEEIKKQKIVEIPAYLDFYHKEYLDEEERSTEKELLEKMKTSLQSEPTILSLFCRCLLLGAMMSLLFIPLLLYITPRVIDIGNISGYEPYWAAIFMLLPFVVSTSKFQQHLQFVRKQKRMLLTYALVKVQENVSEEIYREIIDLYNRLIQECDNELEKYKEIEELLVAGKAESGHASIPPATTFNQPLAQGQFMGEKILRNEDRVALEITCGDKAKKISALGNDDYLYLLKELLKTGEGNPFHIPANTLDDTKLAQHVEDNLNKMREWLESKVMVSNARNIALMLADVNHRDSSAITLEPLFKMAGINGEITKASKNKGLIIRGSGEMLSSLVRRANTYLDGNVYETEPFLFVTYWSMLEHTQLKANQLYGAEPELSDPYAIPFSSMITCLFAKYKQKSSEYRIGKTYIPLSIGELEKLDMDINNIKL